MKYFRCLLLAVTLTLFFGCESSSSDTGSSAERTYPFQVVCSIAMVADMVSQVAGEHAEVVSLMGEGVDPHLYKPTRDDVNRLLQADAIFYVGLMLEGRMADSFMKVSRAGIPVFPVTESIDESFLLEPEGFDGHWDPHVWTDVTAWSQCITVVEQALSEYDPANAADYASNAAAYRAQLAEVHEYVQQVVSTIPEDQRYLITAHDAFGYFERAYGVKVKAAQGMSTESEAGVADINELVDFIVAKKIPALFVETSVGDQNLQAVLEGAASKGQTVRIGGELFSDAMGAPGTYRGTYIGMVDHNATTITNALGGEAPEGGFQGKLTKEAH
ncbi:MAG: zinc ABC transporter substrate-binding protein [Verrucomicrobiota bacterium]